MAKNYRSRRVSASGSRRFVQASPRGKHVPLYTARGRSNSSQRWLRRQLNDPYVRQAQAQGYRSRAAFKILEIDDQFHLFSPQSHVVDIGCAPGGWLQVIRHRACHADARLVGVDIVPTAPLEGVTLFCGDAREQDTQRQIWQSCAQTVDVVLSDMAAPMTGHAKTDQVNVAALAETAWDIAEVILKQGGHFVCKVYAGGAEQDLLVRLKRHFRLVKHCKPQASRPESRELYLVALQRKTLPNMH